jgi:hypothetical protein
MLVFGTCYRPGLFEMKSRGALPLIELGATFLQSKIVVIDRANKRVGFGDAPCE